MLAGCLLVQLIMYLSKIETKDELLVICLFHLLGLAMELFKVQIGSWAYPETADTKLFKCAAIQWLYVRQPCQLHVPGVEAF